MNLLRGYLGINTHERKKRIRIGSRKELICYAAFTGASTWQAVPKMR